MPATKRGVFHNIRESKYVASNGEVTFFFSSKMYMRKFLEGYTEHREKINTKMDKHLESNINMGLFADIDYYKKIEKRGFYAWYKGVEMTCEELEKFALAKMTEKNTLDWYETQRQKLAERIKNMRSTYREK